MENIFEYIEKQQNNEFVGIPLEFEGEFKKVLPSIDRGDCWIVTAQTSMFKSSFTRTKIILPIVNYALKNPTVPVKIFLFLLEENKKDFEISLISYLLYKEYGLLISEDELHGREKFENKEDVLAKIKELKPFLDKFNQIVEVRDYIHNPFGIYKEVREYLYKVGTLTYKETEKKGKKEKIPEKYTPNDPNQYVFAIIDHVGELDGDNGANLFGAIEDIKRYCRILKNFFRAIPIIVQQQTMTGDTLVMDSKGNKLADKLSPSLPELGDNKSTARLATHAISLFAPNQYGLEEYRGWKNIRPYGDNFLYLFVHKNRRGKKNVGTALWVEPISKHFEQFPHYSNVEEILKFVEKKKGKKVGINYLNNVK